MVFPYQKTDNRYFPVIKIALIHKNTKLTIEALVDSGANISIFGADVAESLSVNIESGKEVYLSGVGGRILGYLHTVKFEINQTVFEAKVIFSREFLVSFNLIGREDIFDKFTICFNERRKEVELEPIEV